MENSGSMKKCLNKKFSVIALLAVVAGGAALWFVWFGASSLISKEIVKNKEKLRSSLTAKWKLLAGATIKRPWCITQLLRLR